MTEQVKFADKQLNCAHCGDQFIYSAGEQELNRLRGIVVEPRHCSTCARVSGLRRFTPAS